MPWWSLTFPCLTGGGGEVLCKLNSSHLARKTKKETERNRTKVGLHNYLYTAKRGLDSGLLKDFQHDTV